MHAHLRTVMKSSAFFAVAYASCSSFPFRIANAFIRIKCRASFCCCCSNSHKRAKVQKSSLSRSPHTLPTAPEKVIRYCETACVYGMRGQSTKSFWASPIPHPTLLFSISKFHHQQVSFAVALVALVIATAATAAAVVPNGTSIDALESTVNNKLDEYEDRALTGLDLIQFDAPANGEVDMGMDTRMVAARNETNADIEEQEMLDNEVDTLLEWKLEEMLTMLKVRRREGEREKESARARWQSRASPHTGLPRQGGPRHNLTLHPLHQPPTSEKGESIQEKKRPPWPWPWPCPCVANRDREPGEPGHRLAHADHLGHGL